MGLTLFLSLSIIKKLSDCFLYCQSLDVLKIRKVILWQATYVERLKKEKYL